jgi:spermidine/putrescine-binding protein
MNPLDTQAAITRRELIKKGSLAVVTIGAVPSLVAACGGGDSATATSSGASTGPTDISGTVNYYSWQGEDFADFTKSWRNENDVTLKSLYMNDPSEFEAKFISGGGKGVYNLATTCSCFGDRYRELELLTPIDVSKVPNFESLYPIFRDEGPFSKAWIFDGKVWGVPVTWGGEGLVYDSSKMDLPDSYDDLLDPSLKNRILFYDEPYVALDLGSRVLGVGNAKEGLFTREEVEQIFSEYLRPFKEQARLIGRQGEAADLFASGEIVATTIGWLAITSLAAEKGNKNVTFVLPKEGGQTFLDAYIIPPEAPDVDAALAYINETLTPEVQAKGAEALAGGVVTPDAVPLLPPAVAEIYPYDDIESVFQQAPLIVQPPLDPGADYVSFSQFLEMWQEFKSS